MEYKNIIYEKIGKIAIIKINRPKALNALNTETLTELIDVFTKIEDDEEIGCVILTGEGDKAFVAGADISEMMSFNSLDGKKFSEIGQNLLFKIENSKKVVIAGVNGYALGGGCELAMACDIRIASEKAKFGQPEVNLGVIPGFGGTQRLPRIVGIGRAKELIFTGDMIDAQEAYRIGLVNKIVSADNLMEEAKKIADKINSKGPIAIKLAKESINQGMQTDIVTGCMVERENFSITCSTEDQKEGMKAFLEKRKPEFKGR